MYFKFFSENRLKHYSLMKIVFMIIHIKLPKRSLAGSSLSNLSLVHSIKISSPSFNFCWNHQLPHISKYIYQSPELDPFTVTVSLDVVYYWALFFSLNIHPYRINPRDSLQIHVLNTIHELTHFHLLPWAFIWAPDVYIPLPTQFLY